MSRKSKPALLAALSIATVLVFSCASSGKAKPFGPFTLQGMIYDRSGTSVANAAIFFEGRQVGLSDFKGRFYIPRVIPGEHLLEVKKTGYESYAGTIATQSPMDIAYVSLVSKEDLCEMIETALRERHWDLAETYANRALAVDAGDAVVRFLAATVHAIPARQNRNAPEAVALLLGLLEDGFREPVILLFLADLYEYELKDYQKSKEYLERYLRFKDDEAVRERLLLGDQMDHEL